MSLKANKKFPYKLESKTCSQENIKHRHRRKEAWIIEQTLDLLTHPVTEANWSPDLGHLIIISMKPSN